MHDLMAIIMYTTQPLLMHVANNCSLKTIVQREVIGCLTKSGGSCYKHTVSAAAKVYLGGKVWCLLW